MSKVTLKHIYKVYPGGVRAVNDFNLEIRDKEFIVFVGPSGCGKSTTLRMIAGLEDITAGSLYIDDAYVNDTDSKDRDIAMVFQSYALYPHMTVYQNMAFGLKLRHENPTSIRERVEKAAEVLEIKDLLDRKPKELSGGQRQRVALGRAIVRQPNVFLLDEPLSNLDAKLRVQMRTEITKLHERLGTTFIYVTHDQTEAMTMGDRIVVMKDGFIQQADTPITLFEDPKNLFVATFLGSPQMNTIDVELREKDGVIRAIIEKNEDMAYPLRAQLCKQLKLSGYDLSRPVVMGVRPEHVVLVKEGGYPAKVEVVEQLGDETILYTKIANRDKYIVLKMPLTGDIKSGADVRIDFREDRIYLFDKESQQSIIGVPSRNLLPCEKEGNLLRLGGQTLPLTEEYCSHLLDTTGKPLTLGFIPEEVYLEEGPERVAIKVKIDFIEKKTDYTAVYSLVEGLDKYLVFKVLDGKEFKPGEEREVYVPVSSLSLYEEGGNKLNSREVIYPNSAKVNVKTEQGKTTIAFEGGAKLVYPAIDVADGEHEFLLKQEGQRVLFNKAMRKARKIKEQPFVKTQVLHVSCYDEENMGRDNLAFVSIKGFPEYASILIENTFSVYKMPSFDIEVPADGFLLR